MSIDPNGEKMKKTITTKFGKAYIAPEGYYTMYTRNENRTKKLHPQFSRIMIASFNISLKRFIAN